VKPIFTNIRLHWKDFPRTNTLAYSEQLSITAIKSLIILGQDGMLLNLLNRPIITIRLISIAGGEGYKSYGPLR
jgi:hypothetical protein